ncbi:tetratricopeptide repeat protein [Marinobacterium jannaschii]|uniref:tetratricopeptide repeat protein n=1 Tax=Marinobacterium jannaschii TaxID=64970 RepID=UPI0004825263|nr:tetratricopeptide repeat protein [Marinobacterium jannaschii]
MLSDPQGHPLTGASEPALELYNQALSAFNLYLDDPVALLDSAIEQAPQFSMAHIVRAYLYAFATEPAAASAARGFTADIESLALSAREQSLLHALQPLLEGNWGAAATALDYHNVSYPLDLVALQSGHLMDFYRANARDMRDRIARVLPQWSPQTPGYSIVLGMYAFGIEESGDYHRAEAMGHKATELEPRDCWAHHAVAHVLEMQGRTEEGIGWMRERELHWAQPDNFFKVHNWWHLALCHLDLQQFDQALAIYDGPVRSERSEVALDMVDASALLWRLSLAGRNVGERWQELAACWDQHADARLYPFNDWHAVMAYLGAGRYDRVDEIRAAFQTQAGNNTECAAWATQVALPLIEGFFSFWHGDFRKAAHQLHEARFIVNRFGGSHAQRDIIDWTLTESALRGGLTDLAEAMAHERLALKPDSRINLNFLARAREAA